MSQTEALDRIERARRRNAKWLNLSNLDLTELPPEIGELTELRVLWLNNNRLTELPPEIGHLRELRVLQAYENQLTALPPEIGHLRKLQRLITPSNEIAQLPEELGQLIELKELNLGNWLMKKGRRRRQLQKGNQLKELSLAFETLTNLQTLSLSSNQLKELSLAFETLTNLQTLFLNSNQLKELPPAIEKLTNLRKLDLSGNQLKELPPAFEKLINLQYLDLDSNQLTELPPTIETLTNLQSLYLNSNQLKELSPAFEKLTSLQRLDLSSNQLKELPSAFEKLIHLQRLWLYSNQLTELPPAFEKLTNLQELDLSSNQLKELPSAFEKLIHLQRLWLYSNQLTELPPAFEKLTNLQELSLSSNQLTELPPAFEKLIHLQRLLLNSNQLMELPAEIENLEQLSFISLGGNPLGFPPLSIAEQGMEAIRNYLAQEVEPLWVAKMVVVGQGRVGKTSLLKRLRDNEFDPDQDSTHGMEIGDLTLPHPTRPDVKMRLNTWDFGGQELYHATHQFYLTDRSLYLIVWNAGENYQQGGLIHWLDTVKARAPKAKIILVATHADQRAPDIPFDEIKKQYQPMIADRLYLMDNKNGTGREELLQAIAEAAAEMKMMGQKWPVPWKRATEAIRERAKTENHITPQQLTALLETHGVDEIGQRTLTRWLHQLGEILFYDEDQYEELNYTVMLNPQWVNQIISRVLDSKQVEDKKGVLTGEHMKELWKEIESPLRKHLLRLMDQFDLSYEIPDDDFKLKPKDRDRSLVVEKLPREEADYHSLWESKAGEREIARKLELATLLPGIPSWFIARSHRFTTKTHWRLGALFADGPEQKHLALVRASATEKWVSLSVRGPSPHNFFALLNDGLMKTFERFPGLDYKVKVPCCCSPNCPNEFELEDLESADSENMQTLPCLKSKPIKQAFVRQMLLGQRITPEDPLLLLKEIKADTEQLKAGTGRIEIAVSETLAYQQREFTKLFNALQSGEETYCPNVFALRTGGGDGNIIGLLEPIRSATMWEKLWESVGKRSVELQLYCQQPGHWHPVGCERGKTDPESGLYQIEIDSEFLQAVGPYLIRLSKVMKYVLPALGLTLPWITDKERYEKVYKADIERWTKFADAAAKNLPELFEESAASKAGRKVNPHAAGLARGDELRLLRKLLEQKDPNGRWGKLRRFMTKEGHWLWLCSEHLKEYQD